MSRRQVGHVVGLWRYPVKSMGGELLQTALVGLAGLQGDRLLAFVSSAAPIGSPLVTGAERAAMLRCQARFVSASGTPANVEIKTPAHGAYRANDPALITALQQELPVRHDMRLECTAQPRMDCRPIALLSLQTLRQFSDEAGMPLGADRFRANILLDLGEGPGFGEDRFAGRTLRIGSDVTLQVKERIPRCRVITIDPASGEREPALMAHLARHHEGRAGIYATATMPGAISTGDPVFLE